MVGGRNSNFSYRGLGFDSYHPLGSPHPFITPADPTPLSDTRGAKKNAHKHNTHIQKSKKSLYT